MPVPYQLPLTAAQQTELAQIRDHAPVPYLRERAAILLKVASGQSITQVAQTGGLKPHHPDTVCTWVHRYEQAGLAGLHIRPGRGRKSAFSPSTC